MWRVWRGSRRWSLRVKMRIERIELVVVAWSSRIVRCWTYFAYVRIPHQSVLKENRNQS
jgi:hypothetical protein